MKKTFESMACPVCDDGELMPFSDGVFSFRHGKRDHTVPHQHYAECSVCGVSGYLPGQRAANAEAISAFQAKLVDYVSPSDVLAVRERYSLTQKQAALIFKGGVNGFSKWERGISFPSGATATLIKVALASFDAMKELAKIANIDFPIIDSKAPQVELGESTAGIRSAFMIQCTHPEYAEDYSDSDEVEDSENTGIWKSEKIKTPTRNLSSLN